MLPFRTLFYDASSASKPPFGRDNILGDLPASKAGARKLVCHVFIENYQKEQPHFKKPKSKNSIGKFTLDRGKLHVMRVQDASGETVSEKQDGSYTRSLKTRLPHHLLGAIDVMFHLLKNLRLWNMKIKLERYCPKSVSKDANISENVQTYSTPNTVFLFQRSVLTKLLPKNVWGSPKNRTLFNKNLFRLLSARKYDKINWILFAEDIKISEMKWLKGGDKKSLLKSFIVWLMNDVIFVLIRRFFYITESGHCKNRMFYYRKETWKKVESWTTEQHKAKGIWKEIEATKTDSKNHCLSLPDSEEIELGHFSFFTVRLIPKSTETRVVMFKRDARIENPVYDGISSIPDRLLLVLLTGMWNAHPEIRGASGFGVKFIHSKWRNFMDSQRHSSYAVNYFVKIDVKNCFDTIPHKKLLEVMESILTKYPHSTIPVDQKRRGISHSTKELWLNLKNSLQNVLLQLGDVFYKKMEGIPQGWKLASMLCNIFYADFEQREFPYLLLSGTRESSNHRLLIRMIDDFMLVTTDIDEAIDFIKKMHRGYPEYNLAVNPQKTVLNFVLPDGIDIQNSDQIQTLNQDKPFPWFGHLFLPGANTSKFSQRYFIGCGVGIEMARYGTLEHVRDFVTVCDCKEPDGGLEPRVVALDRTLLKNITSRMSGLCSDRGVNSFSRLMRNAFEISVLMALQWLMYFYHDKKMISEAFFMSTYKSFMAKTIRKKFAVSKHGSKFANAIEFVCLKAVFKVLRRYRSDLRGSFRSLEFAISKQKHVLKDCGLSRSKEIVLKRVTASCPVELMELGVS